MRPSWREDYQVQNKPGTIPGHSVSPESSESDLSAHLFVQKFTKQCFRLWMNAQKNVSLLRMGKE
jgi:hypothetical protein